MGMYTELRLDCVVRAEGVVLGVLKWMFNSRREKDHPPHIDGPEFTHPLFRCPRLWAIGCCGSAYFDEDPHSTIEHVEGDLYRIVSVSNFKNYDNEIQKFADWIRPIVQVEPGAKFGSERYECADEATDLLK